MDYLRERLMDMSLLSQGVQSYPCSRKESRVILALARSLELSSLSRGVRVQNWNPLEREEIEFSTEIRQVNNEAF